MTVEVTTDVDEARIDKTAPERHSSKAETAKGLFFF